MTIKDQLKAIKTGFKEVSIEPRKDPPMPVATLPAKVDGRKTHQQRVPTGCKANAQGLKALLVSTTNALGPKCVFAGCERC